MTPKRTRFHFAVTLPAAAAWAAGFLLTALAQPAAAHTLGQGYLMVDARPDRISGRLEVTLDDLDAALDLDADGDGKVTDAELTTAMPRVLEYLGNGIGIGANGTWYDLTFGDYEVSNLPLGRYLVIEYTSGPETVPPEIDLRYDLIFEADSHHRGYLVITGNTFSDHVNTGEETSLKFSPKKRTQTFDLRKTSRFPW
jgi:hypothetical protein